MREYFLHLLHHLDKLTGIKQFDRLCNTDDPKGEIKLLLDILCRVCEQFPFIPDDSKRKIIDTNIVVDQEFIGLNARIIFKWLNMNKDLYFKELAHVESKIEDMPLTGEAREIKLKEWLEVLNKLETITEARTNTIKEFAQKAQPIDGKKYKPMSSDQVYEKERHIEYVRNNFDVRGDKKPDWIPEHEFNKLYDEGLIP